jgi:SAM-dependent methyltransferase
VLPFHCPTEHTVDFLCRVLSPGGRLLEVGCGGGDVALSLRKLGYRVVAIDTSKAAVQRAKALGVDAREIDLVRFDSEPFDAVIFTRSLHHVGPLAAAIARAHDLVVPGGILALEELDHAAMDGRTATWLFDAEALLESTGILAVDMEEARTSPGEPVERWRAAHAKDPAMHSGDAMTDAVKAAFTVTETARVPYLYRHVIDRLEAGAAGYRVARELLAIEERRIKDGTIRALGLRVVATRRRV